MQIVLKFVESVNNTNLNCANSKEIVENVQIVVNVRLTKVQIVDVCKLLGNMFDEKVQIVDVWKL